MSGVMLAGHKEGRLEVIKADVRVLNIIFNTLNFQYP
ncbi:MAG: hypothetical protein ACI92O_002177 [Colwellia sp.]